MNEENKVKHIVFKFLDYYYNNLGVITHINYIAFHTYRYFPVSSHIELKKVIIEWGKSREIVILGSEYYEDWIKDKYGR